MLYAHYRYVNILLNLGPLRNVSMNSILPRPCVYCCALNWANKQQESKNRIGESEDVSTWSILSLLMNKNEYTLVEPSDLHDCYHRTHFPWFSIIEEYAWLFWRIPFKIHSNYRVYVFLATRFRSPHLLHRFELNYS